jgi:flagellar biosynthesis protein FlhF
MQTKTYFSNSVQAAMEVARREMGPDAMLVNSRPAPDAARPFGRLEVTFAWDAPAPGKPGSDVPGNSGQHPDDASVQSGEPGLEEIRREIPALRAAIGRTGNEVPRQTRGVAPGVAPELDIELVSSLCGNGFEEVTACRIAGAAVGSRDAPDAIMRELTARISVAGFLPLEPEESRTLAFAGPPGRGKSTSLVKIAFRFGIACRIPTRIITAGAHGVGAAEQMARYSAILGVPHQAVESWDGVHLALQGDRWRGLTLLDTSGLALSDRHEMDAMTKLFARRADIEKHLVIRAEARSADMQYMISQFAAIQPSRLLFTGVDEVRALGTAADAMIRSGLAVSFFGTGPRVPDDLEVVNAPKLVRSLLSANRLSARAA